MLPYHNLIVPDKNIKTPLYRQISGRVINLIQDGVLLPGTFLPGTRQMAITLNVNRKTIITAFNELLMHEWIKVVPRKGYCISLELPVIKPRSYNPVDNFSDGVKISRPSKVPPRKQISNADLFVNDGFPDLELAPFKEIGKVYRDTVVSNRLKQLMTMKDEGGLSLLRETVSLFINETRGMNITQDKIVITRGAQMAIYIAVSILVNAEDKVVVSDPNYIFADQVIEENGAKLIKVPVDKDGMDIDALEKILEEHTIKLLYIVPHHHHPTTVTLTAERRIKLLHLIEKYGFYVIEDDYDYDFHYQNSPILPLASSYHNGKIIYIGSFTKLLAPSIRIGYLIAAPEIIKKATRLRQIIDLRGDTFLEYSLAQMIISGELSRHIKKSLKLYGERCESCCALLTAKLAHAAEFVKPAGGMAVWIKFKPEFSVSKIRAEAATKGLILGGMSFESPGNPNHNGIRFGFASLTLDMMERAIDILAVITNQKLIN